LLYRGVLEVDMGDVRVVLPLAVLRSPRVRRALRRAVPSAIAAFVLIRAVDVRLPDCARAARESTPAYAAVVCQREFADTADAQTGRRLAQVLLDGAGVAAASEIEQLVGQLLPTLQQAQALMVLAELAVESEQLPQALALFEAARASAAQLGDHVGAAQIARSTAALAYQRGQLGDALAAFDRCLVEAAHDARAEVAQICHMSAALTLVHTGAYELAERELDAARRLLPREALWSTHADLAYTRGNLAQERERGPARTGLDAIAVQQFEAALAYDRMDPAPALANAIHLNLVASLIRLGRLVEAEAHLAQASAPGPGHARDRQRLAAELAHARGDHAAATAIDRAIFAASEPDDRISIATLEARVALAQAVGAHTGSALRAAEQWARDGVAAAEEMRAAQGVRELRATVQSRRHLPYELRFLALARAGRLEDALLAFAQGQARAMQDALAAPPAADLRGEAERVRALERWLPVATPVAAAQAPSAEALHAALQPIDLLALIVADGEVWSISARRGEVTGHRVGAYAALAAELDAFTGAPEEPARAAALGPRLVGAAAFEVTSAPLHVLLDGRLAGLPVAALRGPAPPTLAWRGAEPPPLIALRPTVRVPSVPTPWCAPVAPPRAARVLADADPAHPLPASRVEAAAVARIAGLDSRVFLGPDATRGALAEVEDGALVHLAVHTVIADSGAALALAGGSLSALEIATWKRDLPLVVLSTCESARAATDDLELDGALAYAFLTAGARRVVATLRPVPDDAARAFATRFYAAGGLGDPVHALARVQAELARTGDPAWPLFTIFARDTCSTMQ
jgi:hypothetical protein